MRFIHVLSEGASIFFDDDAVNIGLLRFFSVDSFIRALIIHEMWIVNASCVVLGDDMRPTRVKAF